MVDINRKKRIDEAIKHELANILLRHPDQPLFKQITVTAVDVSADLSIAKVFFSLFSDEKVKEATQVLKQAAWFLRKALARGLNLRVTPRLRFIYDESIRHGQKMSELIDAAITADEKQKKHS